MSEKPTKPSDKPEKPGAAADKPAAGEGSAELAKVEKAAKPPPPPPKPAAAGKAKGKGGFNPVLILVPIALIAAIVLAVALPPTRAMLAKTPLKPLLARLPGGVAAKPEKSADPVAEAKKLNEQVQTAQKAAAAKDAQIAALQSQVNQLTAPPTASPTPAAKPTAPAITDDVKRAATYWAGMDADKAAAIVKQLPDSYVKLVFSQMPPDSVSDIMSELPAKTAARLTSGGADDGP